MSVAAIAGVVSPLFFGWIYSLSVGEGAVIPHPGAALLIAAAILVGAALLGWAVARRAVREEKAAEGWLASPLAGEGPGEAGG
jgi:DHA1 family tetracycline resistance protein-like MFS transporter